MCLPNPCSEPFHGLVQSIPSLGLTTKHIYFAGSRKKFRVRYDRIVSIDPYEDGFGIMRDAQTTRTQTFRTHSD